MLTESLSPRAVRIFNKLADQIGAANILDEELEKRKERCQYEYHRLNGWAKLRANPDLYKILSVFNAAKTNTLRLFRLWKVEPGSVLLHHLRACLTTLRLLAQMLEEYVPNSDLGLNHIFQRAQRLPSRKKFPTTRDNVGRFNRGKLY